MPDNPSRVLVVDDDDSIRTMVERVRRRERFEVDSARDGFEAIEKLSQNDYATVLLDLMMPRVDGHGVLQYLERNRPEIARSVIVMTANLPSAHGAAKSQSVFRVLSKPFEIQRSWRMSASARAAIRTDALRLGNC